MTETRGACVALLVGSLLGLCSIAFQRPPPPEAAMSEDVMAPDTALVKTSDAVPVGPDRIEERMSDLGARLDAIQAEIESINP